MTNPFSNFALFELLYAHRAQGILLVVVSTKLKDEECPMPPGIMRDMKAAPLPPPPLSTFPVNLFHYLLISPSSTISNVP